MEIRNQLPSHGDDRHRLRAEPKWDFIALFIVPSLRGYIRAGRKRQEKNPLPEATAASRMLGR